MPLFDPPLAPLNFGCVKPNSGGSTGSSTSMLSQSFPAGQLPGDSPINPLPMPPNASLYGSSEYSVNGQTVLIDADISAPAAPADVLRFYQQAMPALGWTLAPPEATTPPGLGGQVPSTGARGRAAFIGAVYCSSKGDPWLALWAGQGSTSAGQVTSDVWAVIHPSRAQVDEAVSPCPALATTGGSPGSAAAPAGIGSAITGLSSSSLGAATDTAVSAVGGATGSEAADAGSVAATDNAGP